MDKWAQLYVKAPEGSGYTTPQAMKRIHDHLTAQFPATFCCLKGTPIQESDGTWEVQVFDTNSLTMSMVKRVLTEHYGLEIVKQELHG